MQHGQSIGQQRIVAVWRFNEQLRFVFLPRTLLQRTQAACTTVFVGRQVALEGETLPVRAGRHQRQQNAACAHQRPHFKTFRMRQSHQIRARVGHGGAACLAH